MRHALLTSLAALLLAACTQHPESPYKLSNPDATPEARQLFETLGNLYGRRTISGAMANVNWNDAEARLVHAATGQWPDIIGLDLIDVEYTDTAKHYASNPYEEFDFIEEHVREGGIVTVGWHWSVPAAPDSSRLEFYTKTTFRTDSMLVKGTWENAVMERDLGLVIAQLRRFKEAGIPVLWRPLHEASGNRKSGGTEWFWWGNGGAEPYVKLWRHMYDRFRREGLNNLIWVWTTQTGYGDDLSMGLLSDSTWYPGDEYVDLIGRDAYNRTAQQLADEFKAMERDYPGKMLVLSECGGVGKISEQWALGARWGFFMPWYTYKATSLVGHLYADTDWWADAMAQDFVVTRSGFGR